MTEPKWVTLFEVHDRLEAEIIREALEAQGLPTNLVQEAVTHYIYPITIGPVSTIGICVPAENLAEAQAWLQAYQNGSLEQDLQEKPDPPDHE